MDILNKNQRETAIWRLIGFGAIVLAVNALILFASYRAFDNKGSGDAADLARQLKECRMKAKGDQERLDNEVTKLKMELKKQKDNMKNPDQEKKNLESEIKFLKTQLEVKQADLTRCQTAKANG